MNALPQVAVTRNPDGGWIGTCSCGWTVPRLYRPSIDIATHDHRAECARRSQT